MRDRYHVTFQVEAHPEGIRPEDAGGRGVCDAALVVCLLYAPDGSWSTAIAGVDGRTGTDLDAHEIFRAWGMLTDLLAKHPGLSPVRRAYCASVLEHLREAMAKTKARAAKSD